jgi:hypothetical protein
MGMLTASTISPRFVDHFSKREQAGIGETQRTMLAASGDMHERKAEPFHQACLNAVIAARRNMACRFVEHFF